ncbi:hypothetical protein HK405_005645 [Cladochytrium tenue]|nr:hypothetical protein HK405_005645 [Cladochytrium tenue]
MAATNAQPLAGIAPVVALDLLMRELGYVSTSSPKAMHVTMDHAGISTATAKRALTADTVARVLAMMCKTITGLDASASPEIIRVVLKSLDPADIKALHTWDVEVFVSAVYDLNPQIDWYSVIRSLDQKDFLVVDGHGIRLLLTASKVALHDVYKFPIEAFFGLWSNPRGQLSFLRFAIHTSPDVFALAGAARRVIPDSSPTLLKGLPQSFLNQPWNSLDLTETLIILADVPEVAEDARVILENATQQAPELIVLGVAQAKTQWTALQKDLASGLVLLFLNGHPNSSFVLPILWQVSQQLCMAGLVLYYSKDPSSLSRILDVAQEMKALSQILETKSYPFAIDLAALASRRDYLNLEKWLQDRIRLDGNVFIRATLEFLREKVASQLMRPDATAIPNAVPLSVQVVAIFLRILQSSGLSSENADFLKELMPACFRAYPRLASMLSADEAVQSTTYASEVEDEATSILHKCYEGKLSVPQVVELLQRYRDSPNQRELDVFSIFSQVLFEEYQFFPNYPDDILSTASVLFGSLILSVYTRQEHAEFVAQSLRSILDSLRQPISSKYFQFASIALTQFKSKLPEWPNFCSLLLPLPQLHQALPDIANLIKNIVPIEGGKPEDSLTQGMAGIGTDLEALRPTPAPVFAAVKIDTLLEATGADSYEVPSEGVQDRILFILNNLTFDNLETKLVEMKERLTDAYHGWLSHYLVVNRASIEPNNHELYYAIIDGLKSRSLYNHVLYETYSNILVLINSEKTVTSSSERGLLNNLGTWLGGITLARNKPIKHKNLSFKDLLFEGYDSDRLIVVVPFVCKQSVPEDVVYMIVADNLDLACSVMEKAAAEKAVVEIDEALATAYLARRKHREQRGSQPFYDVGVFTATRYPASLPELLRLKAGGLIPSQLRVYEEFVQDVPRRPENGAAVQTEEAAPTVTQANAMGKFTNKLDELDSLVSAASDTTYGALPQQHEIRNTIRYIISFLQTCRDEMLLPILNKFAFKLYDVDSQLSRECYIILLERSAEREFGKRALKEFYTWLHYSDDERKFNVSVMLMLLKARMINVLELDIQLARQVSSGSAVAAEFSVEFIRKSLSETPPIVSHEVFFNTSDALSKLADQDGANVIPHSCIQLRNLILSAFPRNMRLPDPLTPNLKVDLLPEINQPPHVLSDYTSSLIPNNFKTDIDAYLKSRGPVTFLTDLRSRLLLPASAVVEGGSKFNIPAINALVLYVGVQAITQSQVKPTQGGPPITHSAPMDVFQRLVVDLDSEEATQEVIQEQITRVLIERLIVNRPHPYGLLITFIELIRNPRYNFWDHTSFIRCAPEIEVLFISVQKSIQTSALMRA